MVFDPLFYYPVRNEPSGVYFLTRGNFKSPETFEIASHKETK